MISRTLLFVTLLFFMGFNLSVSAQENEAAPNNESLPFEMKQESADKPDLKKIILILFFMVVLILAVVFFLKKIVYSSQKKLPNSSLIGLLSSKKVSMKLTVHLIEIENIKYIIAEKDNAISVLPHTTNQSHELL